MGHGKNSTSPRWDLPRALFRTASLRNPITGIWGNWQPAEAAITLGVIGFTASCTAFEAYCQTYPADLNPDRFSSFPPETPNFPRSSLLSIDCLQTALDAIHGEGVKRAPLIERLRADPGSLGCGHISEILSEDVGFLPVRAFSSQCARYPRDDLPEL